MTIQNLLKQINIIKKLIEFYKRLLIIKMIRRICEEEGLSIYQENVLLAVIKCESGLNPRAINKNTNGTVDYGLCQFNDYWYWKREQIIHPDVALNNPEKSVRVMIEMYKQGRLKNWICYRNQLHLKYL